LIFPSPSTIVSAPALSGQDGLDVASSPARPVLVQIEAKGREHLQAESTRIGKESKLVEFVRKIS